MARYVSITIFVLTALAWAAPQRLEAANLYVDGSCSVNGNGTVDGCASSSGGGGAYTSPASCFSNARAGDTCFIKNGTYITTNQGSGDPSVVGGFHVVNSGTASAPIVFRNYPGHSPILSNCSLSATDYGSCARPTISGDGVRYFTIQGLRIRGGIWLYGANMGVGQGEPGIVIQNNEIWQGWGEVGDGNWAALFLQNLTGAYVHHNFIHDLSTLSGGGQQSSGSCVKLYQNTDSIVEYNTCRTVAISESQGGGIDDKAQAVRNIHRFNWMEDVPACVRVNNQLASTGVQVYGNVCIARGGQPGLKPLTGINGIDFYNNTVVGFTAGVYDSGGNTNVRMYNNIFWNNTLNNMEMYSGGSGYRFDYNSYTPGRPYRTPNGWYTSLAAMQSGLGWDTHSREGDCQFQAPGSDYHLRAGSACIGFGRTGGVPSGSPVDLGAYGVATCVGHTCGGGGSQPTAPSAPTNLRIGS